MMNNIDAHPSTPLFRFHDNTLTITGNNGWLFQLYLPKVRIIRVYPPGEYEKAAIGFDIHADTALRLSHGHAVFGGVETVVALTILGFGAALQHINIAPTKID